MALSVSCDAWGHQWCCGRIMCVCVLDASHIRKRNRHQSFLSYLMEGITKRSTWLCECQPNPNNQYAAAWKTTLDPGTFTIISKIGSVLNVWHGKKLPSFLPFRTSSASKLLSMTSFHFALVIMVSPDWSAKSKKAFIFSEWSLAWWHIERLDLNGNNHIIWNAYECEYELVADGKTYHRTELFDAALRRQ